MKRFLVGFLAGILVATSTVALADTNVVRLFVNGKEIVFPEAPPTIINDRVMVPARPLAEALGAKVEWNQETQSVIVTSVSAQTSTKSRTEGAELVGSEWIDLRNIAESGATVTVGTDGRVRIIKGNVTISFAQTNLEGDRILVPVEGTTGEQVRVRTYRGRTYLLRSDAERVGLIN